MNEIPASFRIFGFGKITKPAIDQLSKRGYDGVSATMVESDEPTPTEVEKMAIILVAGNYDAAKDVTKTFHDADVLTLVIATASASVDATTCDSVTVCDPEKMADSVECLLDAIVKPCMICFDFNDLSNVLEDSGHFKVATGLGTKGTRVKDAMDKALEMLGDTSNKVERMAVLLYVNPNSENPVQMNEISSIPEHIQSFPESIDVVWGVYNDETVDLNSVKITIIASGKEMQL